MGLFNRHQLSIILKLTVFLSKCIGWAKTNVSLMWRGPLAKKCEPQTWNKHWLLQSRNWNVKIGIRISIYLFCGENWKLVSNLRCVFFAVWKLKFDSSFSIFWKSKLDFVFQSCSKTDDTRVHALNSYIWPHK